MRTRVCIVTQDPKGPPHSFSFLEQPPLTLVSIPQTSPNAHVGPCTAMLLAGGGGGRLLQPPSAQDPQMAEYGHRKWSKTVLPWRVPCPSGKEHTACSGGFGPILNCPENRSFGLVWAGWGPSGPKWPSLDPQNREPCFGPGLILDDFARQPSRFQAIIGPVDPNPVGCQKQGEGCR